MSQTNNPCALLIFIMAVSVEVSANTVPVTDLVNDTAAQSNPVNPTATPLVLAFNRYIT